MRALQNIRYTYRFAEKCHRPPAVITAEGCKQEVLEFVKRRGVGVGHCWLQVVRKEGKETKRPSHS